METPDAQASKRFRHGAADASGGLELRPWYQFPSAASRICRVSRASGGKDRHSKVLTAKGLRDRRVRLSVSTAIQFYDLQDRLGYDQPSKAVEWLIKAAAVAIADLPSLDGAFPDLLLLQNHQENENKSTPVADEDEADDGLKYAINRRDDDNQMQRHDHVSKSGCSSTSETSRGSVLSLSRSEIRVKARERARERTVTAKREKDIDGDDPNAQMAADINPQSQSSFIELLTGGGNQNHGQNQAIRLLPATADYFGQHHGFPHQASFNMASEDHHGMMHHHQQQQQPQQQQQLSFLPDQLIPFARGTLQSNFPSMGASNLPFFINASWDSQLQLYYDGYPHLDLKGKEKS